eukprot:CCRYP_014451-RE/>CCRYP_014451-RE protein AED:0.24 eAED:0.37 QI:0/0/0/1/0/0/2/0/860
MTTAIPLKEWIKGALERSKDSVGNSGSSTVPPTYITSALQIAVSLTQQVSNSEELLKSGLFDGVASLPPPFPASCIDWADCITVHLKPTEQIPEHGDSVLQCLSSARKSRSASSLSDQSEDLDELLDKIGQGVDQEEIKLLNDNLASIGMIQQEINDSYFNVDSAQIFYDNGVKNHAISPSEKLQRIYSLGLVFYELFSGGNLPPLDLLVVASPNSGDLTVVAANQEEGQESAPTSGRASGINDFKRTLNIFDDNSTAGNLRHDNAEHCESRGGHHTSYPSNKRQSLSSRSRKSTLSTTGLVLCDVAFDCLSMKGVPSQLCDLICNMIDCINGDFMRSESYSDMVDVTFDLKLMLDKPSVYLDNLDLDKLSGWKWTTLSLSEMMSLPLQSAYHRSISGSSELAIITGVSGTGKSTMANRLGNFITATGGLFLSGKFDQMMQNVEPFSAVASAFNNYCDILTKDDETNRALLVASKLRKALGSDLYYLIQLIPNLSQLVHEHPTDTPRKQNDCVDAQQRLQYLFCQFVEVISSCLEGNVTLFLDDLQWADLASLSLIGQLLKTSLFRQDSKHIFFLGTCRDDEINGDHSFWKMIDGVRAFGFKTTLVKLDCMDKDTVFQVVSKVLHLSPRLVGSLSDIVFHKTKGNPLFVSKMLLSLNREGLLSLSLVRHRWEWDVEKIQSRKLPDDVALFFVHRINNLSVDVKIALAALSCFGTSADGEVIQAIESDLNLNLIEPLNIAVTEGLLNKVDGRYCFCHDRIHEATYSMIEGECRKLVILIFVNLVFVYPSTLEFSVPEEDRCLHHMNYGVCTLISAFSNIDSTNCKLTSHAFLHHRFMLLDSPKPLTTNNLRTVTYEFFIDG